MRVLVVDDDFIALSKLVAILGRYGECEAATYGKQAMKMFCDAAAQGHPYDLITLDIEMPEINGIELLKMMVEKEDISQIPRAKKIMITGSSSRGNVFQAVENRCDAFLVKPVTSDVMSRLLVKLGLRLLEPEKPTA